MEQVLWPLTFPECGQFLDACDLGLDDDLLRHHSFFLDDEQMAVFYSDIHRLCRQELKHLGMSDKAKSILKALDSIYPNKVVARECHGHMLLRFFLGIHSLGNLKESVLDDIETRPPFHGTAVVDVHRHAAHHAIEDNVMNPLMKHFPQEKDLWKSYTRVGTIRALRYSFPDYPGAALVSFKKANVLEYLGMDRRLPMSCLYDYVNPFKESEGPKGGAGNGNN